MKMMWKYVVIAALLAGLTGCGEDGDTSPLDSPDGPDDQALAGGKADSLFGACQVEHLLMLLNEPSTDADELARLGVHRRAANNLMTYRAGDDGQLGSDDDRYFADAQTVDDVYYVGPVAMQQLAAAVDDYCADGPWRQAQTRFSPQSYYDSHIDEAVAMIDGAERSIDLAMYSISDNRAIEALGDAVARGVKVRMLYDGANGDHLEMAGSRSAQLEDLGVDVRYINRIMHHKFAIIDGPQNQLMEASQARFFSGSGNLSYGAATRYDENTTFHRRDPALVLAMQREFNHLWAHSRDLAWDEELAHGETMPIEAAMIPEREHFEVLFSSANFETTYSSRWGAGFRPLDYSEVVADRLIEYIEEAQSSIYVAAGYLRSRPISEALLARWAEDPDLDMRIYLDQSEYISQWYDQSQQRDLEDCLEAAGDDEGDSYDCEQRGFIFSHALVEAGVPLRFKNYSYRWHYSYARQMHHKLIIFDEATVATGSYNFSNNAEQNTMENVIIYDRYDYPEVVAGFVDNFESIWATGRDENRFEELMAAIESDDTIDLIFEPAALTWEEVTQVRQTIRERCPDVDSEPYRRYPEDHRTCQAQ